MRVDQPPFDDVRVRQALKKCVDRQKMLDLAWFGEGVLGHDSPLHRSTPNTVRSRFRLRSRRARALLAEVAILTASL